MKILAYKDTIKSMQTCDDGTISNVLRHADKNIGDCLGQSSKDLGIRYIFNNTY